MSDPTNERNMGNPTAIAGHFGDVEENETAPPSGLPEASPTLTRTGPSTWLLEARLGDLERWPGPDPASIPIDRHGGLDADADADLDHVLATLLPVANLIRTLCGQSRLDAAALLEVLAGSAPHRR